MRTVQRRLCFASKKDSEGAESTINYIEARVAYPFILRVLRAHKSDSDALSSDEVVNVLRMIENLLVRRSICGIPSNALNKIFPTLFNAIQSIEWDGPFSDKLAFNLLKRTGSGRYPLDSEVVQSLEASNLYDRRKTCAIVLSLLEDPTDDIVDPLKQIDKGVLTIEHVMPQTLSTTWKKELGPEWEAIAQDWTHRLGNLTLTAYNTEYSNHPYKDKRETKYGFLDSGLRLNNYMKTHESWGVPEMSERNSLLAESFVDVVKELKTDVRIESKPGETEVSLSSSVDNFENRRILGYEMDGVRVRCKTAAETYLKLLTALCDKDPDTMTYIDSLNGTGQPGRYLRSVEGKGWKSIGHGLYAYYHASNWDKFKVLQKIVALMGIDSDGILILAGPLTSNEDAGGDDPPQSGPMQTRLV